MSSNTAPVLDIDFRSYSFAKNPYPTYQLLREQHPICRLADGTYILSRYDDVLFALKRHDLFASGWIKSPIAHPDWLREECKRGAFLSEVDPPEHGAYNAVINKAFVTRSIDTLSPFIHQKSHDLIGKIRENGSQEIEFFTQFAYPLTGSVIERMTGLNAHTDISRTKTWVEMLESFTSECPEPRTKARIEELILDQNSYYNNLIQDRRIHPRSDLASMLANAKVNGKELTDRQLHNALSLFTIGGFEGPAQSLAKSVWLLSQREDLKQSLVDDPSKYGPFIEELLRLHSSAQGMMRITTKDVTLYGVKIPTGSIVLALIGSANRDPSHFPDADVFDISRANAKSHLSFGYGPHVCIGAALARAEIRIGLESMLNSFESFESRPDHELDWYSMPIGRLLRSLPLRLQ